MSTDILFNGKVLSATPDNNVVASDKIAFTPMTTPILQFGFTTDMVSETTSIQGSPTTIDIPLSLSETTAIEVELQEEVWIQIVLAANVNLPLFAIYRPKGDSNVVSSIVLPEGEYIISMAHHPLLSTLTSVAG